MMNSNDAKIHSGSGEANAGVVVSTSDIETEMAHEIASTPFRSEPRWKTARNYGTVAVLALALGACAGFFANDGMNKINNNGVSSATNTQDHNASGYNGLPPVAEFDLEDPEAPWNTNIPTHEVDFDPKKLESIVQDPGMVEFLPSDLDDELLEQFKTEFDGYVLEKRYEQRPLDYLEDEVMAHVQDIQQRAKDQDRKRQLSDNECADLTGPAIFSMLPENANHETFDCSTNFLSTLVAVTPGSPVVVPAGTCYTLDTTDGSTLSYPDGLRIEGKLYSPPSASCTIRTTFVLVLGVLKMDEPATGKEVKVSLYGESNVFFAHHPSQPNPGSCVAATPCEMGKKGIVVAGGMLDIAGYDETCPSWEPLLDTGSSTSTSAGGPGPNQIVNGDANGGLSPFAGYGNPAQLYVSGTELAHMATNRNNWPRGLVYHGAIDKTQFVGAGQQFLFQFKVKTHNPVTGEIEACNPAAGNFWCPFVRVQTRQVGGSYQWTRVHDTSMTWNTNGWSYFSAVVTSPAHWSNLDTFTLTFVGGPYQSNLIIDDVIFSTYAPLQVSPGPVDQLVVSPAAAACWDRPGADMLITTHTHSSHGEQVVVIDSVDTTTGVITLTAPLGAIPSTKANDPMHAVEVGLLNRKIVFEADSDPADVHSGGHLMIMTTSTVQKISGVEINNFGQRGELGRYPIHFHICEDSAGSIVSKNVVRQSQQRCYVIHGTSSVRLEDNIAYDTFGHCFMLEDGSEHSNEFYYNLGAKTKKMPTEGLISSDCRTETDNKPGTFWISHAGNDFVGNVVAGSEQDGYFLETHKTIRGGSYYQNPTLVPETTNLGIFKDNVAHAADFIGFSPYPPGWHPEVRSIVENLKVYRCNRMGAFLHGTTRITFKNAYIANNGHVGVYNLQADNIVIEDSKIIGIAPGEPTAPGCDSGGGPRAIIFHPEKFHRYDKIAEFRGMDFINTELSHFGSSAIDGVCAGPPSTPVSIGRELVYTGQWNVPSSFKNCSIDDNSVPVIDATIIYDKIKTDDIVIEVANDQGLLTSTGKSGFYVSSNHTAFAGPSCSDEGLFMSFCENTCLRIVRFYTSSGSDNYTMKVTDGTTTQYIVREIRNATYIPGYKPFTQANNPTVYAAALPSGSYDISFEDNAGDVMWPGFVDTIYEQAPLYCTGYAEPADINVIKPAVDSRCDSWIEGGTFDTDIYGWQVAHTEISWSANEGVGGSGALKSIDSNSASTIVHFLDASCVEAGVEYKFEMSVRVVDGSGLNVPECGSEGNQCLGANIVFMTLDPVTGQTVTIPTNAVIDLDTMDSDGYQSGTAFTKYTTTFVTTAAQAAATNIRLQVFGYSNQAIIDNISLDKVTFEDKCTGNVLRNNDLEDGELSPWMCFGCVAFHECANGNCWLNATQRANWVRGPFQFVDPICLIETETWIAKGKVRIFDTNGNGVDTCGWNNCPLIRIQVVSGGQVSELVFRAAAVPQLDANDWADFEVSFTIDASMAAATSFRPVFAGGQGGFNILYDDLEMYRDVV